MVSTQSWDTQGWGRTDEAAVAEARSGNPEAFRVLVERHSRQVYRLAYRMTGNEQDAEDLVQETFLRACRQLNKFDGRASFGTWLYRIAANCSVDSLRARKAREKRTVDLAPVARDGETMSNPLENVATGAPSPERLSLSSEVTRLLAPAMRQLTALERAAFVLRHHEGLSIEEVSKVLKVRPNAAKHSIFRAVHKLRKALEPALGARSARTAS
jgi:RNA polymerase sigma-70 factor, ECF subfamily